MGAQVFHQHSIQDEFQIIGASFFQHVTSDEFHSLGAFPSITQDDFPGLDANVFFNLVFRMVPCFSCAFI